MEGSVFDRPEGGVGPQGPPRLVPSASPAHCSARAGTPPRGPPRPVVPGARCARGASVTPRLAAPSSPPVLIRQKGGRPSVGTPSAPTPPRPTALPPPEDTALPPPEDTGLRPRPLYKRPDLRPFAPRILGSTFDKRTSPQYWGALSVKRSGMAGGERSEFSSLF